MYDCGARPIFPSHPHFPFLLHARWALAQEKPTSSSFRSSSFFHVLHARGCHRQKNPPAPPSPSSSFPSPTLSRHLLLSQQNPEPMSGLKHAFHWFDRPMFYQQMKWLLMKPNGVLAIWCGMLPRINDSIDAVLDRVYAESNPFFAPPRKMVDDEYRSFEFPFEPVEGTEHTGLFEFEAKLSMDLDSCLTLIQSWSAYQTALQKGVDLLREEVVEDFKSAWGGEDEKHNIKEAKFAVFLRIGKVGNE